jgi:hypothetical protein
MTYSWLWVIFSLEGGVSLQVAYSWLWVIFSLKGGVSLQEAYSWLWVICSLQGGVNLQVAYSLLWVICSLKGGVSLREALQCSLDSANPDYWRLRFVRADVLQSGSFRCLVQNQKKCISLCAHFSFRHYYPLCRRLVCASLCIAIWFKYVF